MNTKNVRVYGLDESIVRSGYPMRSGEPPVLDTVSSNDIKRAYKLAKVKSGTGHDNYLKGIIVQFDLQYPEYFSPQLQRYSWIDIVSSQSKMHKITSRELNKYDFASDIPQSYLDYLNELIEKGNVQEIVNALPSGYMKWMGITTNYLQLKTIWNQRCKVKHKLKEWEMFGDFIQTLPISELITNSK